jgi:aspartate aminotransferase-like enzyme
MLPEKDHIKLFIPGPTEVRAGILAAQTAPMIGHRGKNYSELHAALEPGLKRMFGTSGRVFILTSSGSGAWEAAIRNGVKEKALCLVNGAFSERWALATQANGKQADILSVPWGMAIKPEMVEERLAQGTYDALTVVLNETSTGALNPLPAIAEVVRRHPEVSLFVDAVSAAAGVELKADEWGLDVCLTSSQKALALPPGLAFCSVSPRLMEKAKTVPHRGYYFDFLELEKFAAKQQTPATPAISLMQAALVQLKAIDEEGWEARFARHQRMAEAVRKWALSRGFELFAEKGYFSPTVTVIKNNLGLETKELIAFLKDRGMLIGDGYGQLKGATFRIAHMGDLTEAEIQYLLECIDDYLKIKGVKA